jgi:anti-sigma factor RsiW
VDYSALYAYLDGDLPEPRREEVRQIIATRQDWHDEYWKIRALLGEGDEPIAKND